MPKLADDDLLTITTQFIEEANAYLDEQVTHEREKALNYYKGHNPYNLPLVEGRSKMVSTDVRDAVEWILPDLVKIFTGGDRVMTIEPQGDEDTFDAGAAEDWANFVIMRQNNGFLNTYTWLKDALLSKTGFLKQYWKTEEYRERQEYENLSQEEFEFLKKAEDFDIVDSEERLFAVDETGQPYEVAKDSPEADEATRVYSVSGYQIIEESRIVEEPVPPENVLFLPDTQWIPHRCRFVAIESEQTIGDIRALGYDVPDDIVGEQITRDEWNSEHQARRHDSTGEDRDLDVGTDIDPTLRKVWLYEIYLKLDYDGDGFQEWVKIHRIGDTILNVEEIDYPHIYSLCPIIWPHRFVGLSIADILMDVQELMTALNRQILDAIYLANNPRSELVLPGVTADTIDDLLDNRIGGYVRVKQPNTVNPIQTAPLQPWTFNVLEHWEQKKEARTGVTRYSGGLDPNALNKTASGIFQLISQAARRVELIARIMAETGFKDRLRGILDLSAQFPDYVGERILRLTNKQVEITPEKLRGRYDLIVDAGVGAGNREQTATHLLNLLAVLERMIGMGMGPGSEKALVTTQNIFNTVREYIQNALGKRNTGEFITDPSDPNAQRDPPVQRPPSKEEIDAQKAQTEAQLKREQMQLDHQVAMRELELKAQELELKARELELKEREQDFNEFQAARPEPKRAS